MGIWITNVGLEYSVIQVAMKQTILIVEDNTNAQTLVRNYLVDQGFDVLVADNGVDALALLEQQLPHLILLDIMMPRMDGYAFIRKVRRQMTVPVIMLTAKRQEHNIVQGFELGADDYITKPFRMRELLMRIRAVLRRSAPPATTATDESQTTGKITINSKHQSVVIGDHRADLTHAEFIVFEQLFNSADVPVSRATLCTQLSQHHYSGSEMTLKTHIRNLRQKVEPDPVQSQFIETIYGVGYRLRTHE